MAWGNSVALDLVEDAHRLVNEIDLTLTELIIGILAEVNAPAPWWRDLPEARLDEFRRHAGGLPVEHAMNLWDKLKLARTEPRLMMAILRLGHSDRSMKAANSYWRQVVELRNRIKHADRLATPLERADLAMLEETAEALRVFHRTWVDSLNQDPRLRSGTKQSQV